MQKKNDSNKISLRAPKEISLRAPKEISKSTKLRKYAIVYKSYIRKTEQSNISKSPRRPRKSEKSNIVNKDKIPKKIPKKKSLNMYQKFVQNESKKDKYKELPSKQRLKAIALEWKNK